MVNTPCIKGIKAPKTVKRLANNQSANGVSKVNNNLTSSNASADAIIMAISSNKETLNPKEIKLINDLRKENQNSRDQLEEARTTQLQMEKAINKAEIKRRVK